VTRDAYIGAPKGNRCMSTTCAPSHLSRLRQGDRARIVAMPPNPLCVNAMYQTVSVSVEEQRRKGRHPLCLCLAVVCSAHTTELAIPSRRRPGPLRTLLCDTRRRKKDNPSLEDPLTSHAHAKYCISLFPHFLMPNGAHDATATTPARESAFLSAPPLCFLANTRQRTVLECLLPARKNSFAIHR